VTPWAADFSLFSGTTIEHTLLFKAAHRRGKRFKSSV
jgi:hypothetical protein